MENGMEGNKKTIYRSRIDWWLLSCVVLALTVVWAASVGMYWWFAMFYGGGVTLICAVMLFGCWYVVSDDQLIVYQFFRPHGFPIGKIKDVRKSVGYSSTAGLSRRRVSISFTDRSVLKSSIPLQISPKDRDAFISRLQQINPEIIVNS